MKQVISVRDVEELLRQGKDLRSLPGEALLTPSARDLLREYETNGKPKVIAAAPSSNGAASNGASAQKPQPPSRPLSSKSSKSELEEFFRSPYCHELKLQLCDVGRRLWQDRKSTRLNSSH